MRYDIIKWYIIFFFFFFFPSLFLFFVFSCDIFAAAAQLYGFLLHSSMTNVHSIYLCALRTASFFPFISFVYTTFFFHSLCSFIHHSTFHQLFFSILFSPQKKKCMKKAKRVEKLNWICVWMEVEEKIINQPFLLFLN